LWLLRPFHVDQIGLYDEKLVVYHVTDAYSDFPLIADKEAFRRDEAALLRRADVVIVTSPVLLASKRPYNPRTYLVPNAVDYAGFQATLADPGRRLTSADAIARPHIGYVGALNEKIDFDLLAFVAQARPEWQLLLVGALDLTAHPAKADALVALPNVHWLGRLPAAQVPSAIACMDVGLLPYERNEWTANIDSLKLYEYLACGKPVVSTDVPAARAFEALVRIAGDPAMFVAAIEAALADNALDVIAARQAAAAGNTWDMRVTQIEGLLQEALARKQSR
jgi:glycosyltransferase involved in cell wall biosynthesis